MNPQTTDIEILNALKLDNGLFRAAGSAEYNSIWLRDNFYISLAYEAINDTKTVEGIWHGIFDILRSYEWKIDMIIDHGIKHSYEFIHPKFNIDGSEDYNEWGNIQLDAIGAILTKLPYYIRDDKDHEIVQKLVYILIKIKYYNKGEYGMWEEQKVIHASSVGACVAGLKVARDFVDVPQSLIDKGEARLTLLLPREIYEFDRGRTDLALMSLIYPYQVVSDEIKEKIISDIKEDLLGEFGIKRYVGDQYFMEHGNENQWSMGFPWLTLCTGDPKYLELAETLRNEKGEIAESYNNEGIGNDHNPLGWTHAMMICARETFK